MTKKERKSGSDASMRRGVGITVKLVTAIAGSVIIAVSVLLAVVFNHMSQTLLAKSEEMWRLPWRELSRSGVQVPFESLSRKNISGCRMGVFLY